MRTLAASFVALWASVSFASPWDIAPPPRGQWVKDTTGRVSSATVSQLNAIAAPLDASGSGKLGVPGIGTPSGTNPRDFAPGVFNSWGVGNAGANDGILLFFALSDRKSEIVLGDGSPVRSSQTDVVMRDDVVANMKKGRLDDALLESAASLDALMRGTGKKAAPHPDDNGGLGPNAYVTPRRDQNEIDPELAPYAEGQRSFPERSPRTWVVDLNDALTPSQRAQLDVAASDIYSADKGRIFFLVYKSTAPYPYALNLAEMLERQVRPLSKLPAAVIALDLNSSEAFVHLPMGVAQTAWDFQQLEVARANLASKAQSDRVAALLEAARFAQQAVVTGIPPRPMKDVLDEGMRRNQGTLMWGGGGALLGGLMLLRRWNRKRVRVCEKCNHPRQLLSEDADDEHLGQGERKEESLGSVDYDVWWCGRCEDPLVLRYGAIFTRYGKCPKCSAKTKSSTSTTLPHATEYSGGLIRVDEQCEHCSYTNSYTRTTARISRSSSSSSSGGSSFGGGSSSGGGSSGSW